MAQLSDVALVQRPPGRVAEHVAPGELTAHLFRPPPQLAERSVLGFAQGPDRSGQTDPDRVVRAAGCGQTGGWCCSVTESTAIGAPS